MPLSHFKLDRRLILSFIIFVISLLISQRHLIRAVLSYGWTHAWGGDGNSSLAYGVAADSSGNNYTVGFFEGTSVDFDTGSGTDTHTAVGGTDCYVVKHDRDGVFAWARTWGSTLSDECNAVAVDSSGDVYITGRWNGTAGENVDFDGTSGVDNHTTTGGVNFFISKYNSDGTYAWTQTLDPANNILGLGIATADDGSIYITGWFIGTVDFDPGAGTDNRTADTNRKMFLTKYNSSGVYQWTVSHQDTGLSEPGGVATDTLNNVYISGYFDYTLDFDPGAGTDIRSTINGDGIMISKFDSTGAYQWAYTISDNTLGNSGIAYGVASDSDNNIYATGFYKGTLDFDSGAGTSEFTATGNEDIFVLKLNSSGTYVWNRTMGGTSYERGNGISVDSSNLIYVGGYFSGTVDFDPTVNTDEKTDTSAWGLSTFLTSLNNDGSYNWTKYVAGGQQSDGYSVSAYQYGVFVAGDLYGTADFDPDGAGDSVDGTTDYGSSVVTHWSTGTPPTPTPSSTPTPTPTPAPAANPPYTPPPAPSPASFPIIYSYTATHDTIVLEFLPGADPYTNYILEYGRELGLYEYGVNPIGDNTSTSFTIGSLNSNTTYYFRLTPVNHGTVGPASPVFSAGTLSENSNGFLTVTIEDAPQETLNIEQLDAVETFSIFIRLLDFQDNPIEDATIEITQIEEGNTFSGITDTNGEVNFSGVREGMHSIALSKDDAISTETIFLNSTSPKNITFRLNTTPAITQSLSINELKPGLTYQSAGMILSHYLTPDNAVTISETGAVITGTGLATAAGFSFLTTSSLIYRTLSLIYTQTSGSRYWFVRGFLSSLISYLANGVLPFIPFLATIRRRKIPGYVFNAVSTSPIQSAFVVFFSKSGNLKTAFTDRQGKYYVSPKPDLYQIRVEHNRFSFPSKLFDPKSNSGFNQVYLHGEYVTITEKRKFANDLAIPLDPKQLTTFQRKLLIIRSTGKKIFNLFRLPLGLIAVFIATIAILENPNQLTIFSFSILIIFWIGAVKQRILYNPLR